MQVEIQKKNWHSYISVLKAKEHVNQAQAEFQTLASNAWMLHIVNLSAQSWNMDSEKDWDGKNNLIWAMVLQKAEDQLEREKDWWQSVEKGKLTTMATVTGDETENGIHGTPFQTEWQHLGTTADREDWGKEHEEDKEYYGLIISRNELEYKILENW